MKHTDGEGDEKKGGYRGAIAVAYVSMDSHTFEDRMYLRKWRTDMGSRAETRYRRVQTQD